MTVPEFEYDWHVPLDFTGQCYIKKYFNTKEDDVEYYVGANVWLKNRIIHREDGPAIVCDDGSMFWQLYNFTYRLDGPAIIWSATSIFPEYRGKIFYYIPDLKNRKTISEQEYWKLPVVIKHMMDRIINDLTDD